MIDMSFRYRKCNNFKQRNIENCGELKPEIENMRIALSKGYEDDRASINLPDDRFAFEKIRKTIDEKMLLKLNILLLPVSGKQSWNNGCS